MHSNRNKSVWNTKYNDKLKSVLGKAGFKNINKITETLQGTKCILS